MPAGVRGGDDLAHQDELGAVGGVREVDFGPGEDVVDHFWGGCRFLLQRAKRRGRVFFFFSKKRSSMGVSLSSSFRLRKGDETGLLSRSLLRESALSCVSTGGEEKRGAPREAAREERIAKRSSSFDRSRRVCVREEKNHNSLRL